MAISDDLKLIVMHHDRGAFVDPNAEKFRIVGDDLRHIPFRRAGGEVGYTVTFLSKPIGARASAQLTLRGQRG